VVVIQCFGVVSLLRGVDLGGVVLRGVDLRGVNLPEVLTSLHLCLP
jgi:uncharacterized protein YjbI with pentapeptide repeats